MSKDLKNGYTKNHKIMTSSGRSYVYHTFCALKEYNISIRQVGKIVSPD